MGKPIGFKEIPRLAAKAPAQVKSRAGDGGDAAAGETLVAGGVCKSESDVGEGNEVRR